MDTPPSRLLQMTAHTAAHRLTSDPGRFMTLYVQWTRQLIGTAIDDLDTPASPLDQAAQIEAYAAARRRAAHTHPQRCPCTACGVVKQDRARLDPAA